MSFMRRGAFELSSRLLIERGGVLIMTLVFVSMFLMIFIALAGFVSSTFKQSVLQANDELAFQAAEAGLNFGRWRLSHNSIDFTADSRDILDSDNTTVLGTADVTFQAQPESTIVLVTSLGRTAGQPNRVVTLEARYGISSLGRHSAVVNRDAQYGGVLSGAVHANGGIRMDGVSNSLVSSARGAYVCQPGHGCGYTAQAGVWGAGVKSELWEFPVPTVNFNSMALDLLSMRTVAQGSNTYYGPSGTFGYHLVLNDANTYSIYQVTAEAPNVWSWTPETEWQYSSYDIGQETLLETKTIPSNGVIFVEDDVWLEGDVRDRVTVAAGSFPAVPSNLADVIINGDISYGGVVDGSRVLGVVAQRDVVMAWAGVPDVLTLDGAYVAHTGRFGRRYYTDCCGADLHRLKTRLERFGMVASNAEPFVAWLDANAQVFSGYQQEVSSYDAQLRLRPPPYFPTSGQHHFLSWEEVE